jgi:hypothetical protein
VELLKIVSFLPQEEGIVVGHRKEILTIMKITPLKKVSLAVTAGLQQDSGKKAEEHLFSFIYGAASQGLCPFEIQLADRFSGEKFELKLNRDEIHTFFGHLFIYLQRGLVQQILSQQLLFRITINAVEEAEDIEIVSAMKEYLSGGCGGDCGCGCH